MRIPTLSKSAWCIAVLALCVAGVARAQTPETAVTSAFRFYKDPLVPSLAVPTVVGLPVSEDFIGRLDFAVFNLSTKQFEPSVFVPDRAAGQVPLTVTAVPSSGNERAMLDGSTRSYAEFPLPETRIGQVRIELNAQRPITSSSLTLILDDNVALPTTAELRAVVDGRERIVLADQRVVAHTLRYPRTNASRWVLLLTFSQPLRVSELRLAQEGVTAPTVGSLRFLAQPGVNYRVYFDPDRSVDVPVAEAGNLAAALEVRALAPAAYVENAAYVRADSDSDQIPDVNDNCVNVANTDQEDRNGNGRGDACDDFDQDGVQNSRDNCPDAPNRNQADEDSDGIGDVCDGQESRITEKYPWLPWLGIGFAALVLVVLFALTVRSVPPPQGEATPAA